MCLYDSAFEGWMPFGYRVVFNTNQDMNYDSSNGHDNDIWNWVFLAVSASSLHLNPIPLVQCLICSFVGGCVAYQKLAKHLYTIRRAYIDSPGR
jgi:hypothetical protein